MNLRPLDLAVRQLLSTRKQYHSLVFFCILVYMYLRINVSSYFCISRSRSLVFSNTHVLKFGEKRRREKLQHNWNLRMLIRLEWIKVLQQNLWLGTKILISLSWLQPFPFYISFDSQTFNVGKKNWGRFSKTRFLGTPIQKAV